VTSGVSTPIPLQNNFKPPPEPVDSTFGALNLLALPKRSATTVANGYTVEDPTMLIVSRAETFETFAKAATMARLDNIFFIIKNSTKICNKTRICNKT
jgi:hypothetical protein